MCTAEIMPGGLCGSVTRIWMAMIIHCNLSLHISIACISEITACIFLLSLIFMGEKNHFSIDQITNFCTSQEGILIQYSKLGTSTYKKSEDISWHARGTEHKTTLPLWAQQLFILMTSANLTVLKIGVKPNLDALNIIAVVMPSMDIAVCKEDLHKKKKKVRVPYRE